MKFGRVITVMAALAIAILASVGSLFATSVMVLAPLAVNPGTDHFRFGVIWMLGTWLFAGSLWLLLLFEWRWSEHQLVNKLVAALGLIGFAATIFFGTLADIGARMPLIFFSLPLLLWSVLTFRLFQSRPE